MGWKDNKLIYKLEEAYFTVVFEVWQKTSSSNNSKGHWLHAWVS